MAYKSTQQARSTAGASASGVIRCAEVLRSATPAIVGMKTNQLSILLLKSAGSVESTIVRWFGASVWLIGLPSPIDRLLP